MLTANNPHRNKEKLRELTNIW